jgi:methylmalonyl-CoA mutase C-terminal domain/subunit
MDQGGILMMKQRETIRVLMAKAGLDAHERGLLVVSMGLKDEGMEVVYAGLRQTPEAVVQAAIQEDVDVVGISSLAGGHSGFVSKLTQKAQEKGFDLKDILLLVGGIIPDDDKATLKHMGVSATFGPGTSIKEIANYIRKNIKSKKALTGAG